ncbi:hypothetical protein OIDMADRAFT_105167 [Oidiodendron maius Zn]|uniref:GPI inositol-deacylase winged helix domain-containing protein n=1 Tax=Oidiodendron maius (strain Zn) TaxID=913774 RepID=A0A0C3D6V2_OIDMZ|nr:hypothetical protein OIDMADRAFT_105167 [Oidiodendron maius Zn]
MSQSLWPSDNLQPLGMNNSQDDDRILMGGYRAVPIGAAARSPAKGLDAIGLTTLHTPDEVVVDLIFVHGLRGGSHSTWTKNKDVSLFWPQKWLPKDDAFRDVRIHTFGYAAGVGHESVVNIPHFAGSLLSSIYDSPSIKLGENVPLIFIGHSMGGLVIKKAFIIGQDNLVFKPLVDRIRGIFFLATPHHGAHLAQSLSRIFAVAPRPFVGDISPDSPVLESINEDFPRYCSRLDLFSFFENKPMNFFFRQVFIVERQNAVMNYINERKTYLEANHRDVARFSSPKDSSYRAIRDSLAKYIEKVEIVSETILEEETSKDISLFLKANIDSLPVLGFSRREAIANQILQTSSGCFLWVNLILNELRQVSTSAEMKKVLGSSSENMDSLYLKILTDMTTAKFSKDLTKTILTWTTCSFRPLSTKELHTAIELDIKDTINDIERSISTCCGNLVHVDSSKKVQLIHLTLRDFLTRQDIASEFIIERASGHKRLALACLHWIEHLATISELQQVFHAGKTINNLLNRRSQHTPPLGLRKELSLLERWGNDLIHLVTKFGKQLSFSPSSIHHLIAPFCPLDSALKQQFSSSYRGLSVYGLSATVWNDCLSIINYSKPTRPTAVATSAGIFVLGMSTGNIIVYNDITCQESYTLDNGEPVQCLVFGETGKYLASSGDKLVRVWDTTSWSELFKVSIADECIALTFTEEDRLLLGAIKSNQLMYWDIANNGILHDVPTDWMSDLGRELSWLRLRPTMASFNPYQNLLAVIYPGKDILLWDYERECIYDIYEKNSGSRFRTSTPILGGMTSVCSLAFNTTLLAAAYIDGDVVIYDTISGEVSGFLTGINALALSLSLDGRTLASADAEGTIQLFDLDALKVIYRLQSDDEGVGARFLAFTSDSYRVIDVRKYQCLIWEPVVLLRQDLDDENSDTVSVSTAPQEIDYKVLGCICITAIACVQSAPIVFCGKEDGSVHAYDISSEPQNQQLFVQTPGASILLIHFDVEKGILTCSDSSGRVVSRELVRKQPTGWETRDPLVDIRAGTRVTNILASGKHSRLLVSTDGHDTLWQIPKNAGEAHFVRFEIKEKRQWVQHATNPDQLILVTASEAKIYHWTTLEYISLVLLSNLTLHSAVVDRFIALHHTRFFATVTKDLSQIRSSQLVIQIWDKDINLNSGSVSSAYNFGTLSSTVEAVIGVVGDRLIFLNNNYWICSIDLDSVEKTTVRHFFIPNDWVSSVNQLILDIGQNGEIAFVKRAELAVIKRGLEITEKGTFKPPRKGSTIPKPTRLVRLQY